MKKYMLLLFIFIISLSSFGKRNIYIVVHKDTDVENHFFVSAMDTSGNSISDITTSEYSSGDYKTIKISVDTDEEIKVAAGYKWEGGGDYDDYYVLLANEAADGFEEVRDTIVENDSDGDYDYLDILNTSHYTNYTKFPGVEVTSDMRFFAMPVRDGSSNISSNILKEIPFPAPFNIEDGKIITTDEYTGTVKIIASAFTQPRIAGAVMRKKKGEATRTKISDWSSQLEGDVSGYVDWVPGNNVLNVNSLTRDNGDYYELIKELTLNVEGSAGDEITVISKYNTTSQRDSDNINHIITDGSFGYIFVKKKGDSVLPIPGLGNQTDLAIAAGVALTVPEGEDPDNPSYYDVNIGVNDALLLFEHGGSYSATQSYSDMQDLVVLIELHPKSGSTKTMTFIVDKGVDVNADGSIITKSSGSGRQRVSDIGIKIMNSSGGENSFKIKGISNKIKEISE
ncbi:hypothetical protein [uncultured Ilyobacter sp.]|uniref:hypothetical protein n=1 Tax=uncultured Ilyobacter sp. TaxID=544433 RepID=UPI0029F4D4F0|nr:hypothetical protein [uncultured Ilyobacter sp.]